VEGGGGAEQSAARGIVGAGTPQQSGGDAASDEAERSAKARPCRARRPFRARAACQRAPHRTRISQTRGTTADSAPRALTRSTFYAAQALKQAAARAKAKARKAAEASATSAVAAAVAAATSHASAQQLSASCADLADWVVVDAMECC
jgi:hypothetical protein